MEFNKKELKLIQSLLQNSRNTVKEFSTQTLMSPETIQSKITSYLDSGLIKGFSIQLDIEKLFNLKEYICLLKLKPSKQSQITKLITFLKQSKYTSWIGVGFGHYDIKISVYVRSQQDIIIFEKELFHSFNTLIDDIMFNEIVEKQKNSQFNLFECLFEHAIHKHDLELPRKIPSKRKQINYPNTTLSEIQKKLLFELSKNARIPLIELSKNLGTTIENCSYHLKQLKDQHIISKYSIVLNGQNLNKTWVILILKVNPNHAQTISNYFLKLKTTTSVINLIGNKNLQVTIVIDNLTIFYSNLANIREQFESEIFEIEYYFNHEFFKFPQLPEIILD